MTRRYPAPKSTPMKVTWITLWTMTIALPVMALILAPLVLLFLVAIFPAPGTAQAEEPAIEITEPLSGWRNSAQAKIRYSQVVNYPAASVNVGSGHSGAELIRGRITGMEVVPKKPLVLVVNGIPMPLRLKGASFLRPYAFSSGSNTVEIRLPSEEGGSAGVSGKTVRRVQFYENYGGLISPKLRVLLLWDTDGTDLDLHVISPDGQHTYYGNRRTGNGGALDIDVTTGYGPEIYSTPTPVEGTYLVYVNYYGSRNRDDITTARVTVISKEGSLDEQVQIKQVPLRAPGELTLVHTFTYP